MLVLRQVQLRTAYDPEAMLFAHGSPATYALLAVFAALGAVLALLLSGGRRELDPRRLCCPSSLYMTLTAISAFLFLGGGALCVMEGMQMLRLSMQLPHLHPITLPVTRLLTAALAVVAGPTLLLFGRALYRRRDEQERGAYVLGVPFAALLFLFSFHLSRNTDPILMGYWVTQFALVALLMGHYFLAALFHTKGKPRAALWFLLMGAGLGLASLLEGNSLGSTALVGALSVSAVCNSAALLRALYGPAWPDPLPDGEEDDDDTDESDSSDEGSR